jgi:hypothetical protein
VLLTGDHPPILAFTGSAHIEPVGSELVVKSSYSTQANPHTIEEVRRILRLHAGLARSAP